MAPTKPHWVQPSHPDIQEVIVNEAEFATKSLSKVSLPPFSVFAKMEFPPCTVATEVTYATVQMGRNSHLNLNSDLLYINHSCEPSLIFDTGNFNVLVGPRGLEPGDELTFFYPSTEWSMSQPFECLCGTPSCRGTIAGAGNMKPSQLEGYWLSGHIRDLLEEKQKQVGNGVSSPNDPATQALQGAVSQAELALEAAQSALQVYLHKGSVDGLGKNLRRRGLTSRELSGEMGGDTIAV
ncbi:hypothetical protein GMORB2_1100 [Geosmithia morbida]|uniref:Post-SET domain-containing protein n=1 Tax=Geosmithia morbida TaxID=1094350 RepID=A0A9P5D8T9_9HYPO|nr:uncharacterized protein GMORB2_1100 [Geosmithia morbida]KAF4125854.1 hypothetical protein GMORB2_1100 [Geosmithia morbida]